MMTGTRWLILGAGLFLFPPLLLAGQPFETETARLPQRGAFELESTFEFQTSSEGSEISAPLALEYGVTDRLAVLVEPVFYTTIRPKLGASASGLGDLEATLSYVVLPEGAVLPALALAGEVKIPTARNSLIGTGKADYTGYLIASKRVGKLDVHANVGYSILGEPTGASLNNVFNFALAGEAHLNERFDLVGEALASTASSPDAGEGSTSPEVGGGEILGMIGVRYNLRPNLTVALGATYDNSNAFLIRPGLTFRFR